MELTTQQSKQVIAYFAQQAAEDFPVGIEAQDRHFWMTRFQTSIGVERQIRPLDWEDLLLAERDLQSFDRDAGGYLHENGFEDDAKHREEMAAHLAHQVSWFIDLCFNNSGA